MSDDDAAAKRWFPLESNPEVMNAYVAQLGFPTHAFRFCDVHSTDEWALEMVPSPVLGVLMLFPIKPHVRSASVSLSIATVLLLGRVGARGID